MDVLGLVAGIRSLPVGVGQGGCEPLSLWPELPLYDGHSLYRPSSFNAKSAWGFIANMRGNLGKDIAGLPAFAAFRRAGE